MSSGTRQACHDTCEILDEEHILFQLEGSFKSQKLASNMTIRHKKSMILKGFRYVQTFPIFLNNCSAHLAPHLRLRLFLKPAKFVPSTSVEFFQAKVQGKEFARKLLRFMQKKCTRITIHFLRKDKNSPTCPFASFTLKNEQMPELHS